MAIKKENIMFLAASVWLAAIFAFKMITKKSSSSGASSSLPAAETGRYNNTGVRGSRNKNPLNIRRSSEVFTGEVVPSSDNEFKQFRTSADGYRAAAVILRTYRNKYGLDTIAGIIGRFAPATENNTENYIKTVSKFTGIGANKKLSSVPEYLNVLRAMARIESGFTPGKDEESAARAVFASMFAK